MSSQRRRQTQDTRPPAESRLRTFGHDLSRCRARAYRLWRTYQAIDENAEPAESAVAWPQPHKYTTDIAKAKTLLTEAGYPDGFETTLSFDLGFAAVNEPICILVQESLAEIGITTTLNKVPGANWRTELNKKTMPLYTNVFSGWLDYPEYFFYWCYHGQNSVFNTMSYQSAKWTCSSMPPGSRPPPAIP